MFTSKAGLRIAILRIAVLTVFGLLAAVGAAQAESAEDKGLRIAKEVDKANEGWQSESSTMEMVLINAHGDRTTRRMKRQILEGQSDGDRSRIEFEWPADVKGTRMLTWTHKTMDDEMISWLDQEYQGAARIEYYDRKNELLKTATFSGYQKLGKYWRAGSIEVVNHQTKKSSLLTWTGRKLGESLAAGLFDADELDD